MPTGTNVVSRTTQTIKVTVPEQPLRPVRDAYATASLLDSLLDSNSKLANFNQVMDAQILSDARGKYLLAVDPTGLPAEKEWHQVYRAADGISFKRISSKQAQTLIDEGRWNAVLYVNQSAINAAREKRPVALDVDYSYRFWGYLYADDWPGYDARVALAKPVAEGGIEAAAQPKEVKGLLREDDVGEVEKIISRLRERPATMGEIETLQGFVRRVKEELEAG